MKTHLWAGVVCLCSLAICGGCGASSSSNTPATKVFAYISFTNNISSQNTVVEHSLDLSTGMLTPVGSPLVVADRSAITVDPTNKFAYLVSGVTSGVVTALGSIQAFSIDASTGALRAVGGSIAAGFGPTPAVVDPTGKFLYVGTQTNIGCGASCVNTILAFTIGGDGTLTAVPGSPFSDGVYYLAGQLVLAPSGRFLYAVWGGAYAIDSSTGALTAVPMFAPSNGGAPAFMPSDVQSLTLNATGNFAYAVIQPDVPCGEAPCGNSVAVFSVDTTIGTLTPTAIISVPQFADIALAPSGKYAYLYSSANHFNINLDAYSVNSTTGALTSIETGAVPPEDVVIGFGPIPTMDPTGSYIFMSNLNFCQVAGFSINHLTGKVTAMPECPVAYIHYFPFYTATGIAFATEPR